MKLVLYSPDRKEQWNTFLSTTKNGLFMFHRDYMDYHADRFQDHSLMFFDQKDELAAILPANRKDDVLYSHQGLTFGGFLSNGSMRSTLMLDAFGALRVHMLEHGLKKTVYKAIPYIYHAQPAQEDLYALYRMGAKPTRTDISTTVNLSDRLSMSQLRKRGAKKALKAGVTLTESRDFASFMNLLTEVLAKRHETKPVHNLAELELLASRFPQNIRLFSCSKDNQLLASTVIFEYAQVAHAQYIASSDEGREIGALDALFCHLIEEVYKDKKYFDFGISTEENGQVLNEGLIGQKEGFGGRGIVHQFYELSLD